MHRAHLTAAGAIIACTLGGCMTTIELDDDATGSVEIKLDLAGECAGTGIHEDADGVTRWTKTLVGDAETGQCRIAVDWDGHLVDLADLRARAVDKCDAHDCDPDKLDLDLTLTITSAGLVAGEETLAREQLTELKATVTSGDATLFAVDKTTTLPLTAGPDPEVAAALHAAYLEGVKLPAAAGATIALTMPDLHRIQRASSGILRFDFSAHLDGALEIDVGK